MSLLGGCVALSSSAADTYTQTEAGRRAPSESVPVQSELSISRSRESAVERGHSVAGEVVTAGDPSLGEWVDLQDSMLTLSS